MTKCPHCNAEFPASQPNHAPDCLMIDLIQVLVNVEDIEKAVGAERLEHYGGMKPLKKAVEILGRRLNLKPETR